MEKALTQNGGEVTTGPPTPYTAGGVIIAVAEADSVVIEDFYRIMRVPLDRLVQNVTAISRVSDGVLAENLIAVEVTLTEIVVVSVSDDGNAAVKVQIGTPAVVGQPSSVSRAKLKLNFILVLYHNCIVKEKIQVFHQLPDLKQTLFYEVY